MPLYPHQQKALPFIKWFVHPFEHIGEGRSRVLAHALCEIAVHNPNREVSFAKWVEVPIRSFFREELKRVMKEDFPNIDYYISLTRNFIIVK